jgi:hypothetical protein
MEHSKNREMDRPLTGETHYVSLRTDLRHLIRHQGWKVEQISFVTGLCSVKEQDLEKGKPEAFSSTGG